jgi:hypothetical protein
MIPLFPARSYPRRTGATMGRHNWTAQETIAFLRRLEEWGPNYQRILDDLRNNKHLLVDATCAQLSTKWSSLQKKKSFEYTPRRFIPTQEQKASPELMAAGEREHAEVEGQHISDAKEIEQLVIRVSRRISEGKFKIPSGNNEAVLSFFFFFFFFFFPNHFFHRIF